MKWSLTEHRWFLGGAIVESVLRVVDSCIRRFFVEISRARFVSGARFGICLL